MIKQNHKIRTNCSDRKIRIASIFLLCFASVLLTGGVCEMVPMSEPIFREDLIGDYAANFEKGLIDSLRLNDDSTNVRKFMGEDSILFVDTGSWSIEFYADPSDARHVNVVFPAFITRYNLSGAVLGVFSTRLMNITDSVPSRVGLGVLKTKSLGQPPIRLGDRYGMAYLKVRRKKKLQARI